MTDTPFATQIIREDFDRLAQFDADTWNHNNHYHAYLLRFVPARCKDSLDIGCGAGAFTR